MLCQSTKRQLLSLSPAPHRFLGAYFCLFGFTHAFLPSLTSDCVRGHQMEMEKILYHLEAFALEKLAINK